MNKNVESRVKKDSKKEIKKATANIFNNYMKNDFEHNNNLLIEDNNNNNKRRKVSVTTDLFKDVAFDGDQHFDTSNNVNVVSNVFDEQMHFSSINDNINFDGHDEYMMMDINNNDEQDENDFNVENDDDQFYISMQKTENEEFKNDPFISGLHYSSVLLRKYETNSFIDSIMVTENSDSLYPNLYFIHNVNVYSTNIICSMHLILKMNH